VKVTSQESRSREALAALAVDLDGTLIRGDVLWESVVLLARTRPHLLLLLPLWLLHGKAYFKAGIAKLAAPDPAGLPYREEVIFFVRSERRRGRRVVLATATHEVAAQRIANHLDLFDEVLATSDDQNLSGKTKAASLQARCGDRGFDYVGDSLVDLPVFRAARRSILVSPGIGLRRRAGDLGNVDRVLGQRRLSGRTLLQAIRVHQWSKNLLLGTALVASHRFTDLRALTHLAIAFVAFSLAASAVYVTNDLLDLESDRKHPKKRLRPLASGELTIPAGLALVAACLGGSIALSLALLPRSFQLWLLVYWVVTSWYSLDLKRRLLLDVIALAGLYTVRILAGGAAVSVIVSQWLLAFSMFIFMSLAFAKRYVEAVGTQSDPNGKLAGRGYWSSDADLIRVVGPASGLMSVLVLALYINSPDVRLLYSRPEALWLLCPLLIYWITRVWFLAHRGLLHEDPVLFALRDWRSYGVAAAGLAVSLAAVAH